MKKILVFVISAICSLPVLAQTEWVKFTANDRVTVSAPGEMTKMDIPNIDVYETTGADSSSYSLTIVDFENFGLDSAMVQSLVNTESFQEQFKAGFTQQLQNAEITSETIGKLGNFTTYLYEVNFDDQESGLKVKMTVYSVFIGGKVYSFSYGAVTPVDANKDKFFKSIQVI